ncbi:hypothetical protein I7I48_00794 [Histoplasma ohiense]|nr:hypothetical protein I7I48_00794 [Histoplasma ohiense (nom. inval.)]
MSQKNGYPIFSCLRGMFSTQGFEFQTKQALHFGLRGIIGFEPSIMNLQLLLTKISFTIKRLLSHP